MLLQEQRELIVEYGKKLTSSGLAVGTFGNVSAFDRKLNLMAISPSGMEYDRIQPEDVAILTTGGELIDGTSRPSSEADLHLIFYRNRSDVNAVVHTHSPFATTLACLQWPIEPVHYLVAYAGREVPCIPYYPFGSPELAEAAYNAMGISHSACLLGNHGLVAVGASMPFAFDVARQMEFVAQIYYQTRLAGGGVPLDADALSDAVEKFQAYRQA